MRMPCVALYTAAMVCSAAVARAQEPAAVRSGNDPCYRARPYPACRVFFLTNAGGYIRLAGGVAGATPARGIADWGAMVNLSPANAVGVSWFLAVDEGDLYTGPVLRWRRWLGGSRSIDFAVGTPLAGGDQTRPGSVLGLVKFNPVHWFGVAARPELVRLESYQCGATTCSLVSDTKARLYVGVEAGWVPGLALSAGSGIFLLVLVAAIASSN